MIIVNIFNGMEIELTSNEGNYSDNVKIFRHYYYAKMCNLLGCRNLTKEVVSSITAPDFICTSVNIQGNGFAELRFERNIPSANINNGSVSEQVINALPKQEPTVINVAEKEYIDYTGEKVNETLTKKKVETVTSTTSTVAHNTATHNAANTATSTTATPEKRGRGRPKKIKPEQTTEQTTEQNVETKAETVVETSTESNVEPTVESTAEATETV